MDINELTFRIRSAVFQVNKQLGSGFLEKVYENALLNYLKATGYKVGLLINFTYPKAQIKRFVL